MADISPIFCVILRSTVERVGRLDTRKEGCSNSGFFAPPDPLPSSSSLSESRISIVSGLTFAEDLLLFLVVAPGDRMCAACC